jgi:outer membrane murein-binding lipoprotein Lpp
MSEREADIDFDFFDEPETEEAAERPRLPRRPTNGGSRGGPPTRLRTPSGFVPMVRLAGLIAFLILAVIILVFVLRGCASSSKHATYSSYMNKVRTIATNSTQIGRRLNTALTATGIKETDLESRIRGLAAQEGQLADQARAITPPGPMHSVHDHLIEALQLRQAGLSRLADAFGQTATARDATQSGQVLATQVRLLVASDVNWDFYFRDAAKSVLQSQNVTGVDVPTSHIIALPDLASTQTMADVWTRIHGAATGGNPGGNHGSALVSTTALPDGKKLETGGVVNTVTASTDLAFQVAVQDSGGFQESFVKVTLTIQKSPKPITETKTIDLINAGETKNVMFANLPSPPFGVPTTVKVDIQPVPGEKTMSNNSAEYKVIFSLG